MGKVLVTLQKSHYGQKPVIRRTVEALGLRKIRMTKVHEDSSTLRGMLRKVIHLIEVKPFQGE